MHVLWALLLFTNGKVTAQAPKNLRSDVRLPGTPEYTSSPTGYPVFETAEQVISAFNFARRQEEKQMKLPPNSLGQLTLPEGYAKASESERALFLINQERTIRNGADYGTGSLRTLPLEGLETHLNAVAEAHAGDMTRHQFFGHTSHNGRDALKRITAQSVYGGNCYQFMARAENIYMFCFYSSDLPVLRPPAFLIEQALFSWLYQDASSAWGHRETILIQNRDASGGQGFRNDRGTPGSEGFLGIGISSVAGYRPCSNLPGYRKAGHVVVMNIADPAPDCPYTVPVPTLPSPVTGSRK
ncbi:CAP domain-containing protein [Larkinella soli]|uniref:CAP domain-containing protein n=1 Tax=Larkinella soli TaxID=1770527 RepID=UPI000FFCA549|nr:CAP domain-containing protein [Larkinella soli]